MQDDGESFAVGDDDLRNTEYTINVPLFHELAVNRLEDIRTDVPFEARIFADRISASLSPTRTEIVHYDKREVHRRFQLVLNQIENDGLRALVAREVLELAELLTDQVNGDCD